MITFIVEAASSSSHAHLLLFHLLSVQPWRLFSCLFLQFILCLSIGLSCFTINCAACLSVCALNLWDGSQSIMSCLPPQLQLFVSQFCVTIYIHTHFFYPAANSPFQVINVGSFYNSFCCLYADNSKLLSVFQGKF